MGEYHTVFSKTTVELSQEFLENFHDPAIVLSYVEYLASSKESKDGLGDVELDVLEGSFRATASWATICSLHKILEDFLARHKAQDGGVDQDSWERAWKQEPVENDDGTLDDAAASRLEIVDEAACSREDAPAAELAATDEIHSARVDSNVRETSSFQQEKGSNLGAAGTPSRSREIKQENAAPRHSEQSAFLQRILVRAATDREWEFPESLRNLSDADKLDKCPEPVVVLNFGPGLNIHERKAKSVKEVEQILKDVYKMQDGSRQRSGDTSLPRPSDCDEASAAASAENLHPNSLPVASKQKIDSPELNCQQSHGSDANADPIVRNGHGTKATRRLRARNLRTQTQKKFEASSPSDTFCQHQNEHSAPKTGRKRGRPPKALTGKDTRKAKKATKQTKLLKCSKCPYKTGFTSHLHEHQHRVHIVRELQCEVCGKAFGSRRDLKRHEKTHEQPQNCCDICGKMYKGKKSLEAHRRRHDNNYMKPEFPCEICHKAFCTKYVLARHIKQEHLGLKKTYLCPTCGKSFQKRYSYIQHASVHLGLRPYQCETCGKNFPYKRSLELHRFTHDEVERFSCPVCHKKFRQSSSLYTHVKIHTDTKDYICSSCGKGFVQRQALVRHERIHRGDKPFQCLLCQRQFSDASILRRHMILVHKKDKKKWQEDTKMDHSIRQSQTLRVEPPARPSVAEPPVNHAEPAPSSAEPPLSGAKLPAHSSAE